MPAALARQLTQVHAGLTQHPVVQFGNQAIGLGYADEAVRREEAMDRVLPADQGFELADLVGLEVQDRLVIEHQAGVFAQGMAQFFLHLQFQHGARLEVGTEEIQPIAATVLGLIQRQVGVFQQFFASLAVLGEQADADAGGHDHAPPGQLDGFLELLHDALGHLARFITVMQVDENAEFVATKACHHIFMGAHRALDVPGEHLEQFIASIVAEAVVDALEMIDVEEQDGEHAACLGALQKLLGEQLVESTTVDQVGQGVVVRHLLQGHARLVQLAE
ncbi:hypothetical protein D9M71_373990 [compost metagenome]